MRFVATILMGIAVVSSNLFAGILVRFLQNDDAKMEVVNLCNVMILD